MRYGTVNWINENKEWLFSGAGVTLLAAVIGVAKRKAGFKLTYRFYILIFVSLTLTFGTDYIVNQPHDWRITAFIFGLITMILFVFHEYIEHVIQKNNVKRAVRNLSLADCRYVVKCYRESEYVTYNLRKQHPLPAKWDHILYVDAGQMIIMDHPYQVRVYEYAYKQVMKKLDGVKDET